jgi:hypothetical protein
VLGAVVTSVSSDGSCGGPWAHELTPVVKYCGVSSSGSRPVLQVNPVWLRELVSRRELGVLADEMHTWYAIQGEIRRCTGSARRDTGRAAA